MKSPVSAKLFQVPALAVLVFTGISAPAMAQSHDHASVQQQMTPEQQLGASALVAAVKDATERFSDVAQAGREFYFLQFGCVSGSGEEGAMGLHLVKDEFVKDGEIILDKPEILLYEPLPNGQFRLTGADYLVDKEAWDSNPAHKGPPQLMGQLFHLFDAPNRFGLKAFYTLHVWAWKENPNGAFTNWNPNVSCEAFAGQNH